MLLPVWRPVYTFASSKVHNYPPHPTHYHQFNKVWIERLIATSAIDPPPLRGRVRGGGKDTAAVRIFSPPLAPPRKGDGEGGVPC